LHFAMRLTKGWQGAGSFRQTEASRLTRNGQPMLGSRAATDLRRWWSTSSHWPTRLPTGCLSDRRRCPSRPCRQPSGSSRAVRPNEPLARCPFGSCSPVSGSSRAVRPNEPAAPRRRSDPCGQAPFPGPCVPAAAPCERPAYPPPGHSTSARRPVASWPRRSAGTSVQIREVALAASRGILEPARMVERLVDSQPVRPFPLARQGMQACPRAVRQRLNSHKVGTHRVEVNAVADRADCLGVDGQCLVAALGHVSPLGAETIEADRERGLQPMHALDEIGTRSVQEEVVVVRHRAPDMNQPTQLRARLAKTTKKRRPGRFRRKHVRPIAAPGDHMIGRLLRFKSQLALPYHEIGRFAPSMPVQLPPLLESPSPSACSSSAEPQRPSQSNRRSA